MPKITEGSFVLGGLALLAVWLFVGLPWLATPLERIEYREAPQHSAQSSQEHPTGSAQSPFFVQVTPSPKSAEERSQEAEEREEKKSADRWLVRWTAALFAATVGLILATGVLGYFGLQQSRDMKASIASSNAANDLNKQNFDSVHRPQIRIKHLWLTSDFAAGEKLTFKAAFVNRGIGLAKLIECGIRTWLVNPGENLPPHPEFEAKLSFPAEYDELASGITMEMPHMTDGRVLAAEEEPAIRDGKKILVCAGYVIYKDGSGIRTTAFCKQLEVSETLEPARFIHRIDGDYNYED
jgi:hypothetical protein